MMQLPYFKNNRIGTIGLSLILASFAMISCSPTPTDTTGTESTSTDENTEESSSGTLGEIKERDQIVIGVKTDYAPFGLIDKDGQNAGLEIDIAKYLTKELLGSEDKVKFVPVIAANRIDLLKQGQIDIIIATLTVTPERQEIIEFSENYYSAGTGLLTKKDSGVATWDDLEGKTVCGIQGSFYNKDLTEMGITMSNFPGTAEAFKALQEGRCIGFAYDDSALVGKLLEPEWSGDWHMPLPAILPQPWGMGIRKGDTEFLASVNEIILQMEREGLVVEGEKKWNIPPTEYAQQRFEQAQGESTETDAEPMTEESESE